MSLDFVIPSVVEESLTIFSVTGRDEEEEKRSLDFARDDKSYLHH